MARGCGVVETKNSHFLGLNGSASANTSDCSGSSMCAYRQRASALTAVAGGASDPTTTKIEATANLAT